MTVRLCGLLVDNWAFVDGMAMGTGMGDLEDYPLGRVANFAWWLLTKEKDAKEIDKLKARIWQPPRGHVEIETASPWSAENEMKAFSAIKSQLAPKK